MSQTILWGPETYTRKAGTPEWSTQHFSVPDSTWKYSLLVENGPDGEERISSGSIKINGQIEVSARDLNQQVTSISKNISLNVSNEISILLTSKPGSQLRISILGPSASAVISDTGGVVEIPDVCSISFPPGAFATETEVKAWITSSPENQIVYQEATRLLGAGPRLPFEVTISTGPEAPASPFSVSIHAPQMFLASLPAGFTGTGLVRLFQAGGLEVLDTFEYVDSHTDAIMSTIELRLPFWVLTNHRSLGASYEGIITLGSAPVTEELPQSVSRSEEADPRCPMLLISPLETFEVTGDWLEPRDRPGPKIDLHLGLDLRATSGTAVKSMAPGKIKIIQEDPERPSGYGNLILIDHGNGIETRYAHLQDFTEYELAQDGAYVESGSVIGRSGTSGNVAPHLHVELRDTKRRCLFGIGVVFLCQYLNPEVCLAGAAPLTLQNIGAVRLTSCGVSTQCPSGFCLRGGGEYLLEVGFSPRDAIPPEGSVVLFYVNDEQLGGTVPVERSYADSDRSFTVPFMPPAGSYATVSAVLKVPGFADQKLVQGYEMIFDPTVAFGMGTWRVEISQHRQLLGRSCSFCSSLTPQGDPCQRFYFFDGRALFQGDLAYEGCGFGGTLQAQLSGSVTRKYYDKFGAPVGSDICSQGSLVRQCPVGVAGCVGFSIQRNRITISGGPGLPLEKGCLIECPLNGTYSLIPSSVLNPPGFSFDPTQPGTQSVDGGTVTLSYGATVRVTYTRTWEADPVYDIFRDSGETSIAVERVLGNSLPVEPLNIEYEAEPVHATGADPFARAGETSPSPIIKIVPNPVVGSVTVTLTAPVTDGGELDIFDLAGRWIRSFALSPGETTVVWDRRASEGSRTSTGVYFVRARLNDRTIVSKMVIID